MIFFVNVDRGGDRPLKVPFECDAESIEALQQLARRGPIRGKQLVFEAATKKHKVIVRRLEVNLSNVISVEPCHVIFVELV